jgi:hypothetical protein
VSVHQVGFNFNLYKMHGEYNIKYMLGKCLLYRKCLVLKQRTGKLYIIQCTWNWPLCFGVHIRLHTGYTVICHFLCEVLKIETHKTHNFIRCFTQVSETCFMSWREEEIEIAWEQNAQKSTWTSDALTGCEWKLYELHIFFLPQVLSKLSSQGWWNRQDIQNNGKMTDACTSLVWKSEGETTWVTKKLEFHLLLHDNKDKHNLCMTSFSLFPGGHNTN